MKHGSEDRGAHLVYKSKLYLGRFGRMFNKLPPFKSWDKEKLVYLANRFFLDLNAGGNKSNIPAGYTYFGQFINHDLTFDPISNLGKQVDPDGLHNFRTPRFDLDSIYGNGPKTTPFIYEMDGATFRIERLVNSTSLDFDSFYSFNVVGFANQDFEYDLPRNLSILNGVVSRHRAIILDPRNDENIIISQLTLSFLKFHNRVVEVLRNEFFPEELIFDEAQRITRWHYQWLVRNDFLPKVVRCGILGEIKREGRKFYNWKNKPFIPVEFSVAAFRFGHSMVRSTYTLNEKIENDLRTARNLGIFPHDESGLEKSLVGFRQRPENWTIDWERFFGSNLHRKDKDGGEFLQFARKIDTNLTDRLQNLPFESLRKSSHIQSLAQRNLLRGDALHLPSGQAVARAMQIDSNKVLEPNCEELSDVRATLIEVKKLEKLLNEFQKHLIKFQNDKPEKDQLFKNEKLDQLKNFNAHLADLVKEPEELNSAQLALIEVEKLNELLVQFIQPFELDVDEVDTEGNTLGEQLKIIKDDLAIFAQGAEEKNKIQDALIKIEKLKGLIFDNFDHIFNSGDLIKGSKFNEPDFKALSVDIFLRIEKFIDSIENQINSKKNLHSKLQTSYQELKNMFGRTKHIETPLWFYILREAEVFEKGECLGPVGGRIVAEVLIGLFEGDPNSYYHHDPTWSPEKSIFKDCFSRNFTMMDFLNIADGKCHTEIDINNVS